MDQVSIKYTNIFHCKTLKNLPKFGFLVGKQTIWQPWVQAEVLFSFFVEPNWRETVSNKHDASLSTYTAPT
jgi:hypothetical protein